MCFPDVLAGKTTKIGYRPVIIRAGRIETKGYVMSEKFYTDKLEFSEYDDGWWAIGDDNAEYHVVETDDGSYFSTVQKRVAWNSVSEGIGHFDNFEDALYACDDYVPFDYMD